MQLWMLGCKMIMKKSGGSELEEFYPVKPECRNDVPKPRFRPRVSSPFLVPLLLLELSCG